MKYYVDTYVPKKKWHKDSMTALKWLQNKAHDKVKSKILDENDVIAAVLNMLAKEEYGDGKTYRVPNIFYLDLQLKTALFMPRAAACSVLNQIMEENNVSINEVFNNTPTVVQDAYDETFWDLVK